MSSPGHAFEPVSLDFPEICARCDATYKAHLVTSQGLTAEMLRWVHGERSHWNEFSMVTPDQAHNQAQCAIADAQEVIKLSAAIQALVAVESARDASERRDDDWRVRDAYARDAEQTAEMLSKTLLASRKDYSAW